MKFSDLPDIDFVTADKDAVQSVILSIYKSVTGRQLAQGDPVRLFVLVITNVVILLLNKINETGRQNLLKYADGINLDHIGILVGVSRIPATGAITTVRATLSAPRGTITTIPAGTRITAGDNVFFATAGDIVILAGQTTGTGKAICTVVGSQGNGYAAGELSTIVDPVPYVESMVNITTSQGGADRENDENYRERIHNAPESFSCAGASGAYEFFAKKASATIADVKVISPAPGNVVIYPLLENGVLPEQEILSAIVAMCNQTHIRPLTDHVSAQAPGEKSYNINLTYYINQDDQTQASIIQQNVDTAVNDYAIWQRSVMGRDINPSELIRRVMEAGAKRVSVVSPVFTAVKNGSQEDGFTVEIAVLGSKTVTYGGVEDE
jgi:Phage-related baseplate assembly protein|nr:MAG TPA: baseplate assembly protein [Caudoviricetes sp.]